MLDWIIEIFYIYKTSSETFYTAISLFDEICQKYNKTLKFKDIYKIGISSIVLSSKMEDSNSFSISDVSKHISHDNFSIKDIIKFESDSLHLLDFKLYR